MPYLIIGKKTTINFIDVLGESKSNENIRVFDGDIIRIPKSKCQLRLN